MSTFFLKVWSNITSAVSKLHMPGFAPAMLTLTFIFLLIFGFLGIKKVLKIKKGEITIPESELLNVDNDSKPLFKLIKKDYIIMIIMCIVYLIPALYNLGSVKVPETGWAPLAKDDGFIIDLGRDVDVSKVMLYQGYNAEKYDNVKFEVKYLSKYNTFWSCETIEKTGFYSWKVTSKDFNARIIKVLANGPGAVINEVEVYEKGSTKPLKLSITRAEDNPYINSISNEISKNSAYSIKNLNDEQYGDFYTSYKTNTYFDEVFYPRTALDFINKIIPFERTHPPLGKYLVMIGMLIFGVNPLGWRIVGTLFGAAMIPLMYLFGLKVFKERFFAFCTAFLMMFDFMHFVQTRISTIDVYVTFFVILMYYYIYDYFSRKPYKIGFKKSLLPLFLCGLCFGIGIATKWIAMYGAVGIMLIFFITKIEEIQYYVAYKKSELSSSLFNGFWSKYFIKTALACIVFFLLIPAVIYFASYTSFMQVPGEGIKAFFNNQAHMYNFHNTLDIKHSYSSPWWEWPIMAKPIWFYGSKALASEGLTSSIICMGNPLIWWFSIPSLITGIILAVKRKDKYMLVPILGALFQYIPWMIIRRMTFIYHYFSVIPFIMIIMVYLLKIFSDMGKTAKKIVYIYLTLTALLFVLFFPLLSGMIIPRWYASFLQWFPSWSFRY